MSEILDKKENINKENMMYLNFNKAFNIMYANKEHLEILAMLLSKVLKIDYKLLEGNISLLEHKTPSEIVDEKECEKDVVVSVITPKDSGIILKVSIKRGLFKIVLKRNMYYIIGECQNTLEEAKKYNQLPYTILINFNTFFVNNERKNFFEEFSYRDKHGCVLLEKNSVLNINIEECYNLWCNKNYDGKFEPYEEDLMLLCAAMMVNSREEFHNIISKVRMKPEIKKLMEGLVRKMNDDERLVAEYRSWKEEEKLINER